MNSTINSVNSVTKKLNLKVAFTLLLAIFLVALVANVGMAEESAETVAAVEGTESGEAAADVEAKLKLPKKNRSHM